MPARTILVVCPQGRDRNAVRAAGLERRFDVRFAGPDLDALERVDATGLLAELEAVPADAVVATKDRSALLAAVLAERRGLAGPPPAAVARCQHKPTSRRLLLDALPDATPQFAELDSGGPPFSLPCFVKPVVGRLSQNAKRIDDAAELEQLPEDGYVEGWSEIAALAGFRVRSASGYVAEELLTGDEVTVEGYVRGGKVTVIGMTDAVKYEGTNSFERFEYPTRFGGERQAELRGVAEAAIRTLGFDDGFFNVELVVPSEGPARILEVNGRISSQFAPLILATHGRSTYDALFALACGDDPAWRDEPAAGVGVSYVLRVFEDAYCAGVPEAQGDDEILVEPGSRLSVQGANDAQSYRLAIIYEAGETREEAVERARTRARELRRRFDLRPLPQVASAQPRRQPARS